MVIKRVQHGTGGADHGQASYLRSQDLLTPQTATGNCAGKSKSGCMSQGACLLAGLCRGHLLLHAGQHTGTRRGACSTERMNSNSLGEAEWSGDPSSLGLKITCHRKIVVLSNLKIVGVHP